MSRSYRLGYHVNSSHFNVKWRPPGWDDTNKHEDTTVSSQRMISASTRNAISGSPVKPKSMKSKASSPAEPVDSNTALPPAHIPPDLTKRHRLLHSPLPGKMVLSPSHAYILYEDTMILSFAFPSEAAILGEKLGHRNFKSHTSQGRYGEGENADKKGKCS